VKIYLFQYWHDEKWEQFTIAADSASDANERMSKMSQSFMVGEFELSKPTDVTLGGMVKLWLNAKFGKAREV